MKKMKKFLVVGMTCMLACSSITGCGGGSNNSNKDGKGETDIEISYWHSGLGTAWLETMIDGFEEKYPEYNVYYSETASTTASVAAFGLEDTDTIDLYLTPKQYDPTYLEPLNDVLDATVKGEGKSIRDKFDADYLKLEELEGNYYNLTYGGELTFADFTTYQNDSGDTTVDVSQDVTLKEDYLFGVHSTATTNQWYNKILHGRMKFSGDWNDRILLCGGWNKGQRGNGISIWVKDGNLVFSTVMPSQKTILTIEAEDGESYADKWLDIAVSVEMITANTGNSTDGYNGSIRVGIFIDEVLYNNEFITMEGVYTSYLNTVGVCVNAGAKGTTGVSFGPVQEKAQVTLDDVASDFTELSFVDFTYNDTTIDTSQDTTLQSKNAWGIYSDVTSNPWNKKILHGRMKFSGDWNDRIYLCGGWTEGQTRNGISIWVRDGKLVFSAIMPGEKTILSLEPEAGKTYADQWLDIAISVETITEGSEGSIRVGIFIDEKLCNKEFVTVEGVTTAYLNTVGVFINAGATGTTGVSIGPCEEKVDDEQTDADGNLRHLTLDDFGIASGVHTAEATSAKTVASTIAPLTTLLNTSISMNIKITGGRCDIQYASPANPYYGLRFEIREQAILFYGIDSEGTTVKSMWLYPTSTDDSTRDREFKFDIQVSRVTLGQDKLNNDVAVKVLFDNAVLTDTEGTGVSEILLEDMANGLGNGMAIRINSSEEDVATSMTIGNPQESASDFTTLTLEQTGATPDVYTPNTTTGLQGHADWEGSLEGKIFKTNIRFNSKSSQLFYGAPSSGNWAGLWIGTHTPSYQQDTVFAIVSQLSGFTFTKILDAAHAGVQLTNNTFEIGISTRTVDCNGDDVFDDLELGIWFNGKLYNNSYYYLESYTTEGGEYKNASKAMSPSLAIRCKDAAGKVILGDVTHTENVIHCADVYDYIVDSDTKVMIDGVEHGTSVAIANPGQYAVTYTDSNSTFTDNLMVYYTNDATGDGVVNVKDLVALKRNKLSATNRPLEAWGLKAIEAADDETSYSNMVSALLADDNVIGAKAFSDEIIAATGSGTYITSLDVSKEGTSVIGISDTELSDYETNADKFDGSGLDFVLDFDTDRELKVLQVTDTQLMTPNASVKGFANVADFEGDLKDEMDQLIAETKPDLILLTGDIMYGKFDDEEGSLVTAMIDLLESYKIPWAPILGNHEQETPIGTVELCRRLVEDTSYCLFNRRHEVGGNGNYSIGLAITGELQRTIYMMDSRLCYNASKAEHEAGITNQYTGFTDEQILWYRTTVASVNRCVTALNNGAKTEIPSFMCCHISPADTHTAYVEKGYQPTTDGNVIYEYDLGMTANAAGDFGFKYEGMHKTANTCIREYISATLNASGTDGVFMGHQHENSTSVKWNGIRWTFGLKTGAYDANPSQTGGTMITVNTDSTFDVKHIVITERIAD